MRQKKTWRQARHLMESNGNGCRVFWRFGGYRNGGYPVGVAIGGHYFGFLPEDLRATHRHALDTEPPVMPRSVSIPKENI